MEGLSYLILCIVLLEPTLGLIGPKEFRCYDVHQAFDFTHCLIGLVSTRAHKRMSTPLAKFAFPDFDRTFLVTVYAFLLFSVFLSQKFEPSIHHHHPSHYLSLERYCTYHSWLQPTHPIHRHRSAAVVATTVQRSPYSCN